MTPSRPRLSILVKLLFVYVVPTLVLFAGFALLAYRVTRRDLEDELGRRLSAIAGAATLHLGRSDLDKLGPGDESDRRYVNARKHLLDVARTTGVARLYVFDAKLTSRCDTAEVDIGTPYYHLELDRFEIARVFGEGRATSSVLFVGKDGVRYKAGYAPVLPEEAGSIALAVGVEAPAQFFDRLADLRRTLVLYGALLAFVVIAASVVMAALITRPVRELADAAERMGRGELESPVVSSSRDELGVLARTLEDARRGLKQRDERTQMMLSGIAHEVRNPLGGIELFAGILREEIEPGDERRKHVARIEKELGHLKAVVGDFLEFARRSRPEPEAVELADLAGDLLELVRPDAAAGGVALAAEVPADLTCAADPRQLRRALLNLLRNAVQAAAGGAAPRAGIRARDDGDRVVIEVHDSGTAIPAEVREHMFEPFFTTKEKGTGLGLAFVAEIVRDHGGTIEVDSDAERGTTFAVRLPRAPG